MTEAVQMEQIIAFLENADAIKSPEEREKKYFKKRNSLGRQPLQPLQSFYCPITQDVMVDPVEISSVDRGAYSATIAGQAAGSTGGTRVAPRMGDNGDYIPVLIGLLSAKNREIRTCTLTILCILAKDSEDNKKAIAKVDHALELIVRSLARQIAESKLALQLLLDLSRHHLVKTGIGNIQSCIFLLVTASNSNDNQAAKNAEELLDNLSFCNQNVIEMAKANYFKPLLQLLSSDVPQNGLQLIREGAVGPLFELLYRHSLLSPSLREQVAATIMHLAISTAAQVADSKQLSALQVLVQLCEQDNEIVRGNAVKLFCCLTQDGDENTLLEHVGQRCIERLLRIITTSNDLEEIAAAMGIISNLPKDPEITLWLLDAGALEIISTCLTHEGRNASYRMQITENAAAALCRFIAPSNLEWQKRVAEIGIIPVLVELLVSGTTLTKQNAAISLKQFSESSTALTNRVKKRWLSWFCLEAPVKCCPVHLGICTVESSFCILEANALEPLVRCLERQILEPVKLL
ncbi:hypothetical protein GH714_031626 [Hevea brasiliensis]|uniref:RING-type E3 ubiquitin transferase n=1 Tax=Hevea brasiliensis TaxID=3981 RepID=A0A6A6LFK0_HEVBR|nr:hypothetical protein GH714_031626 [Hevea brasiliensis]